ncbi:hypothetical protein GGR54DRAFT_7088 [Hypoxylon sp. NC1633]|nr:hypothetical protein GGR54DRAFT_7088 [Hypoxylon sp. NC1633]
MSYGFGIGDFLAVGELCWKLYREVYRVARNSPREVQLLQQDLSNLNTVVRALQEDCTRPGSSIAQAPPERVKIGRDILGRVENILRSLEDIATRYPLLLQPADTSSGMGSRLRRQVQRILYAGHVREINDCRAQLSHQTGLLQLLLLAANNSSLERIQNQNDRLSTSVEDIRQYIHNPKPGLSSPLISASSYDEQSQFELSRRFNEKAVLNNTAWSAIGIDIWIQIGKWWLMKAQPNLNTPASEDYCQAYVNLLKASWILIDIIAVHPQLNFLSQQLDIQHLGQFYICRSLKTSTRTSRCAESESPASNKSYLQT